MADITRGITYTDSGGIPTAGDAHALVDNAVINKEFVTDKTEVSITTNDYLLLSDASDSDSLKKGKLPLATESLYGVAELATQAEVNAGTDDERIVTPLKLATRLASVSPTNNGIQNFRLTLESGVPVSTSDQLARTTLYLAPYTGSLISLYDGSAWQIYSAPIEVSITVPSNADTNSDVFAYYTGSAVAMELVSWSNNTTRATALTTQDGVKVKSGDATRRYIGTIRTTGVSGQCEDSLTKRFVYNYYNRAVRALRRLEPTASWTYTTSTYRQANGSTDNQVAFVTGVQEEPVQLSIAVTVTNSTGNVEAIAGMGLDVTNNRNVSASTQQAYALTTIGGQAAHAEIYAGIGYHFVAWVEYSAATGTTTWYSSNFSGLTGSIIS